MTNMPDSAIMIITLCTQSFSKNRLLKMHKRGFSMLKNQILTELLQNRSQPLSGQMLANRYQVSRNAIWKTINALKAEGYPIDAIPKEGYLLSPDCDLLSTQVLQKSLQLLLNSKYIG